MSVSKSFIMSTEHMSPLFLSQNNLFWNDTKTASDHFPVIVDFIIPLKNQHILKIIFLDKKLIKSVDLLGCQTNFKKHDIIISIFNHLKCREKIIFD